MRLIESSEARRVPLDGREVVLLCSNDYLGLASHPSGPAAAAPTAERWGPGDCSSRLVSGDTILHRQPGRKLAEFKGYERLRAGRLGISRQHRSDPGPGRPR